MSEQRIVSGTLWSDKLGKVVKVTSVARTPEETWVSYSAFGNAKESNSLLDTAFLQRYKPYTMSYGN